jgi:hypothetical protein
LYTFAMRFSQEIEIQLSCDTHMGHVGLYINFRFASAVCFRRNTLS